MATIMVEPEEKRGYSTGWYLVRCRRCKVEGRFRYRDVKAAVRQHRTACK